MSLQNATNVIKILTVVLSSIDRRIIDSPGIMMFSDTGIKCERCMALERTADPNLPITEGPKFGKEYLDETA